MDESSIEHATEENEQDEEVNNIVGTLPPSNRPEINEVNEFQMSEMEQPKQI